MAVSHCAGLIAWLKLAMLMALSASASPPWTHLLLDDTVVLERANLERVWLSPEKFPGNPIITPQPTTS